MKERSKVILAVSIGVGIILSGMLVFFLRANHVDVEFRLIIDTANIENYTLILPALDGWDDQLDKLQVTRGNAVIKKGSIDGRSAILITGRSDTEIHGLQTMWWKDSSDFTIHTEYYGTHAGTKIFCDFRPANGTMGIDASYSIYGEKTRLPGEGPVGGVEYRLKGILAESWQYLRVQTIEAG